MTAVELSRSSSMSVRRGNTFSLQSISAAEVTDMMQQTVEKTSLWDRVKPYMSVVLWILWVISGTMFYALYDGFGWAKGLLMSVNVGWSIGWSLPSEPSQYYSPVSKVFTIFHATVGAIFLGVAVLFMARDLMGNNDTWIIMSTKRDEIENAHMANSWWHHLKALWRYYMSKLRVARYSVLWIAFGCFWYSFYHDFDTFFGVLDFLASTLCAGGYISLHSDATSLQYVVTALYATIGIPLIKVSLGTSFYILSTQPFLLYCAGLVLSLILRKSEDKLVYEKMVAPVTSHEQEFMEAFGIDDGDGTVDCKEYVILIAVRIGSVPPKLVKEIQDRFEMLDRKRCGEIPYEDLLLPKDKWTGSGRMKGMFQSSLSIGSKLGAISNKVKPDDVMTIQGSKRNVKVTPAAGEHEKDSIIAPKSISSPTSRVTPLPFSHIGADKNENKLDLGGEGKDVSVISNIRDETGPENNPKRQEGVLQTSDSIEHLELPDEINIIKPPGDELEDDISIRSIDTFDGDDKVDVSSAAETNVLTPEARSEEGRLKAAKEDAIETNEEGTNDLGDVKDECVMPAAPVHGESNEDASTSGRRPSLVTTFRATMRQTWSQLHSGEYGSKSSAIKLTPRQRQFVDELEKLKSAQQQIDLQSSMNGLFKFLYFKLLPHAHSILAWILWLAGGAVFYTIREDISVSKGLFLSTSFGYGLFWVETNSDVLTNIYTTLHFLIGIGVIAAAYALLAQKLLSQDKNWYSDALKAKKLQEAMETEGLWDDVLALCEFYWPHVKVHCFFLVFLAAGTAFASLTFGWGFLDCLYFSISTMTSGGVIPLPEDASGWMYLVTCFYVAIGVPVMSISCGILAHQIASRGSAQLKAEKVNAQVSHEEIEKMKWYGIDDANGSIDSKEYVILILVRIGAICPEIISVLQDRFDQLDVKKCGKISYEDLRHGYSDEVVESPV